MTHRLRTTVQEESLIERDPSCSIHAVLRPEGRLLLYLPDAVRMVEEKTRFQLGIRSSKTEYLPNMQGSPGSFDPQRSTNQA